MRDAGSANIVNKKSPRDGRGGETKDGRGRQGASIMTAKEIRDDITDNYNYCWAKNDGDGD